MAVMEQGTADTTPRCCCSLFSWCSCIAQELLQLLSFGAAAAVYLIESSGAAAAQLRARRRGVMNVMLLNGGLTAGSQVIDK